MNRNDPLTVSQLTQAIKLSLEGSFSHLILQGEVSNCKIQSSGHIYFSLKDAQAQISAVMFRGDTVSLRVKPKDGDHVVVTGEINVYPPRGAYQMIVRELSYVGLGELLLKLEQLKVKLKTMGWFDKEKKKPIPKMPKKIGLVTSPTGAAIQDILNILSRRFSGFHLILNPVKVQGEGAAFEIAQAIEQFNRHNLVDVIIVGRGGGSIEDLWAFNEEIVASAIYHSHIPIISAVGHETDICIADYVADLRAPTPSAAAEIVIAEKKGQLQHLIQLRQRLFNTMIHTIKQGRHKIESLIKQPKMMGPYALLGAWMQKIDDLKGDIDTAIFQVFRRKRISLKGYEKQADALKPTNQIIYLKEKFRQIKRSLERQIIHRIAFCQGNLARLSSALRIIDPKNLLNKGYSILFSEKEISVITSVQSLKVDQNITILLSDGKAKAKVTEI